MLCRLGLLSLLPALVRGDFEGDLNCGLGACKSEEELLHSSRTYNCDGTQTHKVTLVTTAYAAQIFGAHLRRNASGALCGAIQFGAFSQRRYTWQNV